MALTYRPFLDDALRESLQQFQVSMAKAAASLVTAMANLRQSPCSVLLAIAHELKGRGWVVNTDLGIGVSAIYKRTRKTIYLRLDEGILSVTLGMSTDRYEIANEDSFDQFLSDIKKLERRR